MPYSIKTAQQGEPLSKAGGRASCTLGVSISGIPILDVGFSLKDKICFSPFLILAIHSFSRWPSMCSHACFLSLWTYQAPRVSLSYSGTLGPSLLALAPHSSCCSMSAWSLSLPTGKLSWITGSSWLYPSLYSLPPCLSPSLPFPLYSNR